MSAWSTAEMTLLTLLPLMLMSCLVSAVDTTVAVQPGQCQFSADCGWRASCVSSVCTCSDSNLILINTGRDCKNASCSAVDCVECSQPSVCKRCVGFILASDGSCVDKCNGQAVVSSDEHFQGNVCREESDNKNLIIGVVSGVGAGIILCLLVILAVCIYLQKTRKKISLQNQQYNSSQIEIGRVKQLSVFDNNGYVDEFPEELKSSIIDPGVYNVQLELLRPHTETLMTLLSEIRPKLRAMDPNDPRVPTYKGVIHQLCRVLVLLHRKETGSSIPSDALGLIEWAHQMLEDYQQQQELQQDVGPDVLGNLHSKISYIDVEMNMEAPSSSAVYAQLQGSIAHSIQSGSEVIPYSSVPVPLPKDTFATIHRSPSVPSAISANRNTPSTVQPKNNVAKTKSKTLGYFANGRYYDPFPMAQLEVYAPASSYSDRSNGVLSTFIPDPPRAGSLSSTSGASSDGQDAGGDDDMSEYEADMFPFDPKDATDPVEV